MQRARLLLAAWQQAVGQLGNCASAQHAATDLLRMMGLSLLIASFRAA